MSCRSSKCATLSWVAAQIAGPRRAAAAARRRREQDGQAGDRAEDPGHGAPGRRGGEGESAHQDPSGAVTPYRSVAFPWPVTDNEPMPTTGKNAVSKASLTTAVRVLLSPETLTAPVTLADRR